MTANTSYAVASIVANKARTMPQDARNALAKFMEGLDDRDLALIVHEALNAMADAEAAVAACVDWADGSKLLVELRDAGAQNHPVGAADARSSTTMNHTCWLSEDKISSSRLRNVSSD
jgi:hypothetical protein